MYIYLVGVAVAEAAAADEKALGRATTHHGRLELQGGRKHTHGGGREGRR
jgi:hypothetical protein